MCPMTATVRLSLSAKFDLAYEKAIILILVNYYRFYQKYKISAWNSRQI